METTLAVPSVQNAFQVCSNNVSEVFMGVSLHSFCKEHDLPKTSVYRKCQELGIETSGGLEDEDCGRILQELGRVPLKKVQVDSGNHQMVLSNPLLPDGYTLEPLRDSAIEAVSFDDPLAVAAQFLQIADQIQDAMGNDLQRREIKLQKTKQAKDAIAEKVQELKLEQRFYKERARSLDTELSLETTNLQGALQNLQRLGKQQQESD